MNIFEQDWMFSRRFRGTFHKVQKKIDFITVIFWAQAVFNYFWLHLFKTQLKINFISFESLLERCLSTLDIFCKRQLIFLGTSTLRNLVKVIFIKVLYKKVFTISFWIWSWLQAPNFNIYRITCRPWVLNNLVKILIIWPFSK